MIHVKWNMASAISITNSETGETIFIPCEGMEISDGDFQNLLKYPDILALALHFKKDENLNSVRCNLSYIYYIHPPPGHYHDEE